MSSNVVRLSEAASAFADLQGAMRRAAFRGLILAGSRGLQKLVVEIIPRRLPPPVDRGLFRAGWKLRIGSDYVEIYNDEPHGVFVEEGVRASNVKPGRAMLEAIAAWAQRKGIASSPDEAKHIAWAIVRQMQKAGIFNDRGPYKRGLGVLRELVDHYLDDLVRAEVSAHLAKL